MDQPVQDEAAVEPGEAGVVADLVLQFAFTGSSLLETDRLVLPIGPTGDDLADLAVVDLLDGTLQR